MTALYLVTGFLGAGKTTFLRQFLPLFRGRRLSLIVNEFGRANVDGELLKEYDALLSGVTGGSIFCTCKLDQFENALAEALSRNPDVIIVETSGLTDPTGAAKVLALRPEFSAIDYRGCVCLADAATLHKVYGTARVCRKQLDACDVALLNKCDAATDGQRRGAMELLARHLPRDRIFPTQYGAITPELEKALLALSPAERPAGMLTAEVSLHCATVRVGEPATLRDLNDFLARVSPDAYRVKGFAAIGGQRYLVDCVGDDVRVTPCEGAPESREDLLSVLYGYGQRGREAAERAAAQAPKGAFSVAPARG
ncbi:MAG: GTP-binding protein [Clostridiales bacterium]|nr:GTP-binding protein [Clostridiales bacterium]